MLVPYTSKSLTVYSSVVIFTSVDSLIPLTRRKSVCGAP